MDCATNSLGLRSPPQQGCCAAHPWAAAPAHTDTPGPCWLTLLGHTTDRLWSLNLFRCESVVLHEGFPESRVRRFKSGPHALDPLLIVGFSLARRYDPGPPLS